MKKKKELLVVGILIGIFCVVGVSYAVWQVTHVQTGENSLTIGCFKVEFTDANPIQIGKAYPIEDSVGASLTPYEFTITNTCNDLAAYQINLEVLNESTMNEHNYIKTMLDEENPNLLTSNPVVEKTLENASTAYKLKKNFLNANETKNFTLRLWLDKNTPADETIMNSVFKSKVTITTSYIDEAPLASGTLRTIGYDDKESMWGYKENITRLVFQDELKPIIDAIASFDESSTQDKSVMSYIVENLKENETDETSYTAYLQSNEKLYLSSGYYLFYNFQKLESIEGMRYLDSSNVTNMGRMFYGCSNLTSLDLSNFNTNNVTNMYSMFEGCSSLTSLDLSPLNTTNVTNMSNMFSGCSSLITLDLSTLNTSNVTNMGSMFRKCSSLTTLDVTNFDTSNVTSMSSMFSDCSNLTTLDLNSFNTSSVTSMLQTFWKCSSLTTLDLSNFNTSNVIDMTSMFVGCSSLTSLDLSNFNTSNVTNMNQMFSGSSSLIRLDISYFNTSNVTDMLWMFKDCSSLTTLDVTNFDTSNVTNMHRMFSGCNSLTTLDLSNFNTEKVSDMSHMFSGCSSLTSLDLSNFNTAKVTDMRSMFYECNRLTALNVSNFDTSNVTNMSLMFYGCRVLNTIIYGDKFIYANEANVEYMFAGCFANKPTHESWSGITF